MRSIRLLASATCMAAALAFGGVQLAAQAKPANATGQCGDGTYTTAKSKRGACSGHDGVKTWFADVKTDAKDTKTDAKTATKDATKDAGKSATKDTKDATKSASNDIKPRPSGAPQDATAKCKDGSYSRATQHRGACSSHGGVAEWYK